MELIILIIGVIVFLSYFKKEEMGNVLEEVNSVLDTGLEELQREYEKKVAINSLKESQYLLIVTNEIQSKVYSSLSKKTWVKLYHSGEIVSMAITENTEFMASSDTDGNITLWDLKTGKKIKSILIDEDEDVNAIDISFNAHYIVFSSNQNVKLWDTKNNEIINYKTMGDRIEVLAITSNGNYTISAGSQLSILETGYFVKVWDGNGNSMLLPNFKDYSKNITSIAITPDDKYIVVGDSNGNIRLFHIIYTTNKIDFNSTYRHISPKLTDLPDIKNCELINSFKDYNKNITALAIDPKAKYIISTNGYSIKIWDTISGKLTHQIKNENFAHYIQSIKIHNKSIISASLHKKAFEIPEIYLKEKQSRTIINREQITSKKVEKQKKNITAHKLSEKTSQTTSNKSNLAQNKITQKINNELYNITNISFEKIRRYYNNLIKENQADSMAKEFNEYARQYKALVYDALEQFMYELTCKELCIVDWGCSQGLGAALVLDYIKEKQLDIKVTQVILIDDDAKALSRAMLHCDVLKQNKLEIISLDTHNGIEKFNKVKNKLALHLCVNDKNIVNFRDIEFDKFENNYFLCLSNKNATIINAIYNQIHSLYETIIISDRKTKVGRYEKYEKIFQIQEIPF